MQQDFWRLFYVPDAQMRKPNRFVERILCNDKYKEFV